MVFEIGLTKPRMRIASPSDDSSRKPAQPAAQAPQAPQAPHLPQIPQTINEDRAQGGSGSGDSTDIMQVEMLKIQGMYVPHYVVPIMGDGSCLFRALSFLIFNSQDRARLVRQQIVQLVASDWQSFRILSHDSRGDNYRSPAAYLAEMSQPFSYGGYCELMAAGRIYHFRFEVYRAGELYASAGNHGLPVRRLRFTDDLSSGHFDAYVLMAK